MRAMIQAGAAKVLKALDELLEYEKSQGKNPLRIVPRKTTAEIVAEGRQ